MELGAVRLRHRSRRQPAQIQLPDLVVGLRAGLRLRMADPLRGGRLEPQDRLRPRRLVRRLRSAALLDALASTLAPDVLVSVGADLSLPGQLIQTRSARNWRGQAETVKDRLVVFGIGM